MKNTPITKSLTCSKEEKSEGVARKYPIRDFLIDVIIKRSNEFSKFQKFEEDRLMEALRSIKELIPPTYFEYSTQQTTTLQQQLNEAKELLREATIVFEDIEPIGEDLKNKINQFLTN